MSSLNLWAERLYSLPGLSLQPQGGGHDPTTPTSCILVLGGGSDPVPSCPLFPGVFPTCHGCMAPARQQAAPREQVGTLDKVGSGLCTQTTSP
jgi:hypothetical protein